MSSSTTGSFNSRLEALERNLAEEDDGHIPTELLQGPQITVTLTGKKRRVRPSRQFVVEEDSLVQGDHDASSHSTVGLMPLPFKTDHQGFETLRSSDTKAGPSRPQLLDTVPVNNNIINKAPLSPRRSSRPTTATSATSEDNAIIQRQLDNGTTHILKNASASMSSSIILHKSRQPASSSFKNNTGILPTASPTTSAADKISVVAMTERYQGPGSEIMSTPGNNYNHMSITSSAEPDETAATTSSTITPVTQDEPESYFTSFARVLSDSPKMDDTMMTSAPPAPVEEAITTKVPSKRHRYSDPGGGELESSDSSSTPARPQPQKRRTTSDKNLLLKRRHNRVVAIGDDEDDAESQGGDDRACSVTTTPAGSCDETTKALGRSASFRQRSTKKDKDLPIPTFVSNLRCRKKPLTIAANGFKQDNISSSLRQATSATTIQPPIHPATGVVEPMILLDSSEGEEGEEVIGGASEMGQGLRIIESETTGLINKDTTPPASPTRATVRGLLADLRVYAIPNQMNKGVYDRSCVMIRQLHGQWLGPSTKIVSMHYDIGKHLPALGELEEPPTHIVTALTSLEALQKLLKTDHIEPSIPIVNASWLQDTIMYKKAMDASRYSIIKAEGSAGCRIRLSASATAKESLDSSLTPPRQLPFSSAAAVAPPETGVSNYTTLLDKRAEAIEEKSSKSASQTEFDSLVRAAQEGSLEVPEQLLEEDEEDPVIPAVKEQAAQQEQAIDRNESTGSSSTGMRNPLSRYKKIWRTFGKRKEPRHNKDIVAKLQELMNYYEQNKHRGSKQDQFKVINYRKAIRAISALDHEIQSEADALKVEHVGKSLAKKINEIIAFGRILKMDHLHWDRERTSVEALFKGIYGVGLEKATEWYEKGLRTLDDVRQLPNLSRTQLLGLKYYDDLQLRIPRSEVEEIGAVVRESAWRLHPDIDVQVTGSFRRGKPDCGDVDIILMRPEINNGDELWMIMNHVLMDLTQQGFLVDHFAYPGYYEPTMASQPQHFKYMGICRLGHSLSSVADTTSGTETNADSIDAKGTYHYRHLDLLVVPHHHHGAALLYFTGNDICNRVMRAWAGRKGMSLSDKGLFSGVVRDAHYRKIHNGTWIAGRTEREVFEALQIEYREPHEREF
ncbi:hypothetical protein BGZ83_008521 [Gryganskiella cystojenkinii]|nr:hypothetical protein BGZ83_008521 [Gryganskiella cystojenkinii]